jgi:hypothetical protein
MLVILRRPFVILKGASRFQPGAANKRPAKGPKNCEFAAHQEKDNIVFQNIILG